MKQIHIRRFLSLLLAALTLWAAAVTAGAILPPQPSSSCGRAASPAPAGAALGAGGLLRSGLLSAVTVMTLAQSPCCCQAAALWQLCCPPV
ncbi:MAG: hypothetical protein ACLVGA_10865 [Dysosmobacter sp.]